MPKVDPYRDFGEDKKEPSKDILSVTANR